jgi:hypothetical protein
VDWCDAARGSQICHIPKSWLVPLSVSELATPVHDVGTRTTSIGRQACIQRLALDNTKDH